MDGDESTDHNETPQAALSKPPFYARPYAVQTAGAPKLYPDIEMSRSAALVDAVVAIGLFITMYITPQVGAFMEYVAERLPEFGRLWSNTIFGVGTIAIVSTIAVLRGQRLASLGLGPIRPHTVLWSIAAVPACFAAMIGSGIAYALFVTLFTDAGTDALVEDKMALLSVIPKFSLATMLLFGAFTGLHEELLFRGLLLTRFNAIARNRAVGVVICAALFGMVHMYQGPAGVVQTATIGLALGTITTLSNSLWPAIIGHATFNSIQLAMLPLLKQLLEDLSHASTTLPGG